MLAIELSGLLETELDFDLCVTGFSIPEIDSLIAGLDPEEPGDPARRPAAGGRGRTGDHPARRYLAPRPAPADLRQRARGRDLRPAARRRAGADGLHRPALQRADRRQRLRLRPDQAPRVRHGRGRDVPGGVHRLPRHRLRPPRPSLRRRRHPFRLHGLAAHGRDPGGGPGALRRAEEPDGLGEGQRRHGHVLSLAPRADLRLQARDGAAHQRLRARPAWPLPDQCLGIPRREQHQGRGGWKSWRCIRR